MDTWLKADRTRIMKRLLLVGLGALVIGALWLILGRGAESLDPSGDPSAARSVILVPGYGGGAEALNALEQALQAAGYETHILDIGDGQGDLASYGAALRERIDYIYGATAGPVHIVGFSAGGVITRSALDPETLPKVGRIVTLGSPHAGTRVASLGAALAPSQCPLACQQLAQDSEFLSSLPVAGNEGRWLSIASGDDEVVSPYDSALLSGATQLVLGDVCPQGKEIPHSGIPRSPGVITVALEFMRSGTVPSSLSQC